MKRQTRSAQPAQNLFIQGLRATRKILAGARRTPSADGRFKRFEKFGNINTAVKEFYSLKPRQVTRVELNKGDNVISGLVGDRQIRMYNNGDNGYPVIEIIDNNAKRLFEEWDQPGTYGEMIVYKQ